MAAKPVAVYVRPVTKTDLRRLAGDVIHDPPVQGFSKPAVARFEGPAWTETAILEAGNLLRCDDPAVAEGGVLYFREPDGGPAELAFSTITGKEPAEVVSRSRAFRHGTEAALVVQAGEPVAVYLDEAGVVLRRRSKAAWGDPRSVLLGSGHGIRAVATSDSIHIAAIQGAAAPGTYVVRYVVVSGDKVEEVASVPPGASCDLSMDANRPVLLVAQQEKVTGLTAADYRIVMVRRAN
jgi:hypothetical protein